MNLTAIAKLLLAIWEGIKSYFIFRAGADRVKAKNADETNEKVAEANRAAADADQLKRVHDRFRRD